MVLSIGAEYAFPTIGDNGRVLAIGGGEPRLIDATTGVILGSLPGLPMLFSPDGQRLAVHRIERTPDGDPVPDGSFVIWDVTADSALTDVACDCSDSGLAGTSTMSFNADGSRIVVIRGGMAEVYDATTGELISTLEVEGAKVISVAYSPDGTRIVTANDNGTVRIWDDP
ncbi:MAG: WD40 repeat domain-containing protein [Ilumatobacteraceae bacterium]